MKMRKSNGQGVLLGGMILLAVVLSSLFPESTCGQSTQQDLLNQPKVKEQQPDRSRQQPQDLEGPTSVKPRQLQQRTSPPPLKPAPAPPTPRGDLRKYPTSTGSSGQLQEPIRALQKPEEDADQQAADPDAPAQAPHQQPQNASSSGPPLQRPCFIASAACAGPMAEEVITLREFRDSYITNNWIGLSLIDFYNRHSPPIAEFIAAHEGLRVATRVALNPTIYSIKYQFRAAFGLFCVILFYAAMPWQRYRKR